MMQQDTDPNHRVALDDLLWSLSNAQSSNITFMLMSHKALQSSGTNAKVYFHTNVWGKETMISHSHTIKSLVQIEKMDYWQR